MAAKPRTAPYAQESATPQTLPLKSHPMTRIGAVKLRADLPLQAIISGGQTGSDQAGLRAAVRLGLRTGGYAPLGYRTLRGEDIALRDIYGLVEGTDDSYARRTAQNVFSSNATVRIANDFFSPGELCTLRAIKRYKKPSFDVRLDRLASIGPDLLAFLRVHNVRILNVAGNAEETAPGIGAVAENFLVRVLGAP